MNKKLLLTIGLFSLSLGLWCQTININGPDSICRGDDASYSIAPSQGVIYTWNIVSAIKLSSTNTAAIVFFPNSGSTQISVSGKDSTGAIIESGIKTVFVKNEPKPVISADATFGCASQIDPNVNEPLNDTNDCFTMCKDAIVTFTANGNPSSTYTWSVVGGSITGNSGNSVTVEWTNLGFGEISVFETTPLGCTGTESWCIEVIQNPEARFVALPDTSQINLQNCVFNEVFFFDRSEPIGNSPIVSWQWSF
ncbi:MAG: hypothetical protein EA358_01875 [Flavobacteriales bacterium]|nr:MAG: hypothetical protein EA358_01875 [Flavobacteriales bacterium]